MTHVDHIYLNTKGCAEGANLKIAYRMSNQIDWMRTKKKEKLSPKDKKLVRQFKADCNKSFTNKTIIHIF